MLSIGTKGFRDLQYVPVGSYPTPSLGYLLFYITDRSQEIRYFEKGVVYDPIARVQGLRFRVVCFI